MDVLVNGKGYTLSTPEHYGGEGEIYSLDSASVAKVYQEGLRRDPNWLERRQKVLALCSSFQSHTARHGDLSIAFPEYPAYEGSVAFDALVGFSMRWFKNCPPIGHLGYDLANGSYRQAGGASFDDATAIGFVYATFQLADQLHQARIVLGDVNDGNLLYDATRRQPVIVDIDSAQIGSFGCPTTTPAYSDPAVASRGKTLAGYPSYDEGTDVFAFGVLCFEFLIGVRPHFLYVDPPRTELENKQSRVSSVRCLEAGHGFLKAEGTRYVDCAQNAAIANRLRWLRSTDPLLYRFFVGLFVRDVRENLVFSLPIADPRHPGNRFFLDSGFKRAIDDLKKRRASPQPTSPVPPFPMVLRPPPSLPDAGFKEAIAFMVSRRPGPPSRAPTPATSAIPVPRTDPVGLAIFLRNFGLDT